MRIPRTFLTGAGLLLIVCGGFWLRWMPFLANDREVDFRFDRAFHLRMTQQVLSEGQVPLVDGLGNHPHGKPVREVLPTGMYHMAAAFHRGLHELLGVPLTLTLLLFTALAGAFSAVPVHLICRAGGLSRLSALYGALLIMLIPGHVHRTACYWYRYEGIGTFLLLCVAYFVVALPSARRRVCGVLLMSGLCVSTTAAIAVWRVSPVVLLAMLMLLVAQSCVARVPSRPWIHAGLVLAATMLANALPFVPGNGAWRLNAWPAWLVLALAGMLGLLRCTRLATQRPVRRVLVAVAVVGIPILFMVVRASPMEASAGTPSVVRLLTNHLGIPVELTAVERIYARTRELQPISPVRLADPDVLSLSALFLILAPWLLLTVRPRRGIPGPPLVRSWLAGLTFLFLLAVLAAERGKILLAPWVAVWGAHCIQLLPLAIHRRIGLSERTALLVAMGLAGCIGGKTAYDSHALMSTRATRFTPAESSYLAWARENTQAGEGILCYWSMGYMIQAYANRPTPTDGFLEFPESRAFMVEVAQALYQQSEDVLWHLCDRRDIRVILLPEDHKSDYAALAGVPYAQFFPGNTPTPAGLETLLGRMLFRPDKLRRFRQLTRDTGYVAYQPVKEAHAP